MIVVLCACYMDTSGFLFKRAGIRQRQRQKRPDLCYCEEGKSYVESLLNEYGWDDRFVTLSRDTLPVLAEIQCNGSIQVVKIIRLEFPESDTEKPPKLIVSVGADETFKVDVGQLTTIWSMSHDPDAVPKGESLVEPAHFAKVEQKLEDLYQSARRPSKHSWTKKQLQQLIDRIPMSVSFLEKSAIESALRQIAKAGRRHEQIVDSMDLVPSSARPDNTVTQRTRAAKVISELGGGRFKRFPCILISWSDNSGVLSIVNGGWMAVDSAVRASREAQDLARTGTSRGTNADERIVQRLEYLAMSNTNTQQEDLQLDVRELLKAMELPLTTEGARKALVQMGIWSRDESPLYKPQPWPPEVMRAVKWYQSMDQKRKMRLQQNLLNDENTSLNLEGRIDLTHLPCICIDAARTSFRDDAIGARPRKDTGRKLSQSSKWEILIHTVDISDLYSPEVVDRSEHLQLLQAAAAKRGSSRYDLPSGPLHLLPPALLETLSLQTTNADNLEKLPPNAFSFNRCITVWVYIDEKTGKLLDAGLERTLISAPLAMTFQSASDLLEDNTSTLSRTLAKAKALLGVVDRDVTLWREYRRQTSELAKAREQRLETREQVDRHIYGDSGQRNSRDDGRDGFRLTRGHRMVDTCLDIHGIALTGLLKRAKACIPYVAGAERDGRVATAPLRRYIDGMVQRQALAVLCQYGGGAMSKSECAQVGLEATNAINSISNIQSFKPSAASKQRMPKTQKQQQAARALLHRISHTGKNWTFSALSTGKQSEVVILEFGAVAFCRGIKGTLKPGEKVTVSIRHVDPSTGKVSAVLLKDGSAGA